MSGRPSAKPQQRRTGLSNDPAFGIALLATGILIIVCVSILEKRVNAESPWAGAIMVLNSDPPWDGTLPVYARPVPLHNFPIQHDIYERAMARGDIARIDAYYLEQTEYLIALDAPRALFESMLETGRLPKAGANEVLAGVFTRTTAFELDGRTFRVVGRLQRNIPGLHFTFVLPHHESHRPLFDPGDDAARGWFDPAGIEKLPQIDLDTVDTASFEVVGHGVQPTETVYALGTIAGLVFVAIGGALAQLRLFAVLATRRSGPLKPVFHEIHQHPFATFFIHAILYGGFFAMMIVSAYFPVPNIWLQSIISEAFTEGELSYVGDAMSTGNIPLASAAIFANNYGVQTLALTFGASLFVPFFGLLKNGVTFAVTGLGMSPIWTEMAPGYIYHSITMTLELEAYVIATMVICVWPVRLLGSVRAGRSLATEAASGLKVIGSAALLAGIMLAVAAVYEAATLLLLGGA